MKPRGQLINPHIGETSFLLCVYRSNILRPTVVAMYFLIDAINALTSSAVLAMLRRKFSVIYQLPDL